ncbi:MAG: hypothetical protein N3A69_11785 [Leptospiraceae bacterium]|nr:hypothetical protein [Leptospiraceae bacterium]
MKTPKFSKNLRISPRSIKEKITIFSYKLDPRIENLRNKIFSDELGELVKQVTEKKQTLRELKSQPLELFSQINNELLNNLNKVYNSKNKKLSLSEYLSYELAKQGFSSFVLFQFYSLEGLYKPEMYFGISSETGEKFYFHSTGIYLKQLQNTDFLEFNENVRGDIFFQKKIAKSDFELFSGIILHRFEKYNLVGMLGCFCKENHFSVQRLKELEHDFQKILEPIFPVLGVFFHEQKEISKDKFEDYRIYTNIVRYARSIIIRGESQSLYIYNIQIQNYFDVPNRWEKKKTLVQILLNTLKENGYLLEQNLDSFYYVSKVSSFELLQKSLNSPELEPFQFLLSQSEYPKDSANLFMHF